MIKAIANFKKAPAILRLAINIVKAQQDALTMVTASDDLLTQIAVDLAHRPKSWLRISSGNWFYNEMLGDIRASYPELPHSPLIYLSARNRWTLVAVNGICLPLIFINRGGVTSIYRLVLGKGVRWLPQFYALMQELNTRAAPPSPNDATNAMEHGLKLVENPSRDAKWDIQGVQW